jgi:hypothetical protein
MVSRCRCPLLSLGLALALSDMVLAAPACDELAGRLLAKAIRPAIEGLECRGISKVGLDRSEHRLESICYTSSGPQSRIEIASTLKCRTSDRALIKSEVSEHVTAFAVVRASDCQIVDLGVNTSGELGQLLLRAFDVPGKARDALQLALSQAC